LEQRLGYLNYLNPYIFHINLYDLVFLGAIFIGLTSTLLLWFTKRINQAARLHRLLAGFGLLWLLWIPYTAVNYFYYHYQLDIHVYYPLYLLLGVMITWIAAKAFLRPEAGVPTQTFPVSKPSPPAELKQKGIWLKKAMEANLFYQDAELSLGSLAEKLDMHPHELSRIINIVLKKNFNDFINEYRVLEVTRKMQEPAYDRMTLLGIALDAGFNSKATFNRAFRQMTGKSPKEYKNDLKKERSTYHLRPYSQPIAIVSYQETAARWSHEKLNRNYMFRNYFKIAIRQFRKQKMYAAIKIGGFALSIAACLLIALYIRNEMSYDKSYPDANRIFRLLMVYTDNGTIGKGPEWPAPLAKTLKADFPQIELSGRLFPSSAGVEVHRADQVENSYEEGITFADQGILDLLKMPMVYGNRAHALVNPLTVVISKRKADKYFPGLNPVGKVIYFNNDKTRPYTVSAVMENFPATSHLQYDFLVTLTGMEFWPGEQSNWNNYVCTA
jgi:putative ABC transport system permease protein